MYSTSERIDKKKERILLSNNWTLNIERWALCIERSMFMQSYNFWLINFEPWFNANKCERWTFSMYVTAMFCVSSTAHKYVHKVSSLQQNYGLLWIWNMNGNPNHKINKTIHWKIKLFANSHQAHHALKLCAVLRWWTCSSGCSEYKSDSQFVNEYLKID